MTAVIPDKPMRRRRVMGSRIAGLSHRQVAVVLTEAMFDAVRAGAERRRVAFAAETRRLIGLALAAERTKEPA
jgi:hypothetical protein